jgi:predicted PurR-regulated permease PerM
MDEQTIRTLTRRVVLAVFLSGLLILSYQVLQFFFVPVAWAGILAFVTWPIYHRIARALPRYPNSTAGIMTLLLAAAFVAPMIWLVILLRSEVGSAYEILRAELEQSPFKMPEFVSRLPWVGDQLQALFERLSSDRESLRAEILHWLDPYLGKIGNIAGSVTHTVANLGFALLTVYFFYRDGPALTEQLRRVLERFLGARSDRYLKAVGDTTQAVVYGIVLTALAQGLLAGLGYWGAGMQAPVLLGAVTGLVALVPFGTPFVWGSAAIWLLATGHTMAGIGLALWGTFVVSMVDNLIRPLVISTATRIPFLLVMFGVLGGLVAFGPVGLFLGPVVLAVLLGVWQEWVGAQSQAAGDAGDKPPPESA